MQSVSSRIWTRVAVFISYDDNDYTTDTSKRKVVDFWSGRGQTRFYGIPAHWLSQWVESWRCTNSQHSKKLCLSLLMSENLKLKKVNESFVPELKESRQCFVFFVFLYAYEHSMIIVHVLCMWISWSYFWTYMLHSQELHYVTLIILLDCSVGWAVEYTDCCSAEE